MTALGRRRLWRWVIALVLLGAGGAALFLSRARSSKGERVDPKLVVRVTRGDLQIDVVELGRIEPRERVAIKSRVAGQAQRVLVEEGMRVKRGQLLLVLDPVDFQRSVVRAQQEVDKCQAALELATITLARKKRGLAERGVSQADVDLAENELRTRRINLGQAREQLATARDQLRFSRITSPLDGTVTLRNIQPGETVVPGVASTFDDRSLLTVSDLSVLIARADLNQIDVARVRLGQAATLTLDALPGKSFRARVTKIAPASILPKGKEVDVFPIEATLEAGGDLALIKPGMTADVRVHIETRRGVLKLPIEAVVKEKDQHHVTRVSDDPRAGGKAVRSDRVKVVVGARNDRDQEIVSGLREAERVLIKPPSADANEWK
jgi:HlyD family secretion protein/macrolide-specific efflux system membrane fusion protein